MRRVTDSLPSIHCLSSRTRPLKECDSGMNLKLFELEELGWEAHDPY
jgi:hypothetical protein